MMLRFLTRSRSVHPCLLVWLVAAACGDSSGGKPEPAPEDGGAGEDASAPDGGADGASGDGTSDGASGDGTSDGASGDGTSDGASGDDVENDFGFHIAKPGDESLSCGDFGIDVQTVTYLCSFAHGETQGVVYFAATPAACEGAFSATFEARAYFSQDGEVTKLTDGAYDWGGNHHNDAFTLALAGTRYRYYHSSFGFGWRACQLPDCLQVLESDGVTVREDGCTAERSLPVSCVNVEAGKRYGTEQLTDTFMKCPGDPNP